MNHFAGKLMYLNGFLPGDSKFIQNITSEESVFPTKAGNFTNLKI